MLRREKSDWPTDPSSPSLSLPTSTILSTIDLSMRDALMDFDDLYVCMYVTGKNKIRTTCFRTYNRLKDIC